MKRLKQKDHCKDCTSHWTLGRRAGGHNNWCRKVGICATKAFGHCKLNNLKTIEVYHDSQTKS